jgi:hypothetical protein
MQASYFIAPSLYLPMVSSENFQGKQIYLCDACHFGYATKPYAEKCEAHCKQHNACSLEITKHAVKR